VNIKRNNEDFENIWRYVDSDRVCIILGKDVFLFGLGNMKKNMDNIRKKKI
jgi:hypothetical protein